MRILLVLASLIVSCWCSIQDELFSQYDGPDRCLSKAEFENYWLQTFDLDESGDIDQLEFLAIWRHKHFADVMHAPLYFLELDAVPNERIDHDDLTHMFKIFDTNGDGCIRRDEFDVEWDGLFSFSGGGDK